MEFSVYSLPRREHIGIRVVAGVVNGRQRRENFYLNCLGLFPVVLGRMSDAEIAGQRKLPDWKCDRDSHTDRYYLTDMIKLADRDNLLPGIFHPEASKLHFDRQAAPLLDSWKSFGTAIYGREDFGIECGDTLRRSPVPEGRVIGGFIHGDKNFHPAYCSRVFSILSICADEPLHSSSSAPAWWATHWHDARRLSLRHHERIERRNETADVQRFLSHRCPAQPLPVGQHILMPTFMWHSAGTGRFTPVPERHDQAAPQPNVYVSHAMLHRPLGTLRHPVADCCVA